VIYVYRLVFLVTCAFILSCSGAEDKRRSTSSSSGPQEVKTLTLRPRSWAPIIYSYGRFESPVKISLSVDFSSSVEQVYFQVGQSITKGQRLIDLDSNKQELRLKKAVADVSRGQAVLKQAEESLHRHERLFNEKTVSKDKFDQAETDYKSIFAMLEGFLAAKALAEVELRETMLVSPVNGIVVDRTAEAGLTVLPGTSLGVVQISDPLRVVIYVTEKQVNSLRIGQTARITSTGVHGKTFHGEVMEIGASADLKTGNYTVKLKVDNKDGKLRAGMSAKVSLKGEISNDQLLIPSIALVDRGRQRVVYKYENGLAKEVKIVLGIGNGDELAVIEGLAANDQIIVEPLSLMVDKKRVSVIVVDEN
jgi:RND family efflux transporter MFP subunit